MTYHFPDAYAGTNTKIRDTLNNLILKSPQNWQTSVGLPFFQIQGTVVEWVRAARVCCANPSAPLCARTHAHPFAASFAGRGSLRCPSHAEGSV